MPVTMMLENILVPLAFFIASAIVIVKVLHMGHTQRMAMIERGMNPSESRRRPGAASNALKFGLLILFLGLGMIVGRLIEINMDYQRHHFMVAGMLMGGGIGLTLYYLIDRKHAASTTTVTPEKQEHWGEVAGHLPVEH